MCREPRNENDQRITHDLQQLSRLESKVIGRWEIEDRHSGQWMRLHCRK